ncbi:MAG: Uma2 family endonuclease [Tepidiformaceae bacterium]
MPVTEQTFEQLALEDDDTKWEMACWKLREKPGMTQEHNSAARRLAMSLARQLDPGEFEVGTSTGYTERESSTYFLPDVIVIPRALVRRSQGTTHLEVYREPLPFVAEVWSPSTGSYDVDTKFPEYKLRGDLEIWRVHPYDKTMTAWRRQADGAYSESAYASGIVPVESLPGVAIELGKLFE